MKRSPRDRISIDLRGTGERIRAIAEARGLTQAALLRRALLVLLTEEADDGDQNRNGNPARRNDQTVKVTLRMSGAHAVALATRAREADVSQGSYVAGLIDGTPPGPVPPDHADAVAALVGSTDQLAVMGTDLNAFMRLLSLGKSAELERYRAGIMALSDDVRGHLALAAALVAELRSTGRPR